MEKTYGECGEGEKGWNPLCLDYSLLNILPCTCPHETQSPNGLFAYLHRSGEFPLLCSLQLNWVLVKELESEWAVIVWIQRNQGPLLAVGKANKVVE